MIDTYLWQELVVFAKTGTLAKTAETLHITQPSVTRGLQKLEDTLGVSLFDHQPNKLTLTALGELAVQEGEQILQRQQLAIKKIRNFAAQQDIAKIASTAPGPLLLLNNLSLAELNITQNLLDTGSINENLLNNRFTGIISNQEVQNKDIESVYLGKESLIVNLDKFMYHSNQASITFKELARMNFVVLTDIGPWQSIIQEEIPDAKFMYQAQRFAFTEITKYSNFPYFSTNLSSFDLEYNTSLSDTDDRIPIPVSDEAATMDFYISYLKTNRPKVAPLVKKITQAWPQ
ncbi:LysR family transcriptional regulator [Pediococcus acidilactici]|uniref:LysR family transcriptional regulator n=1 Tax=Pediococcus acidilactici TaxID=1254 RepID=UPI00071AF45D|nr:LysR family transcriptional regulator [Pediococcus acidilactici]KSV57352.1 LysR family transcriptional regulator [Pediococcus acidilactici]